MKLGFFTACFSNLGLQDLIKWGSKEGFQMIEVACWPRGEAERRYAGVSHIDVENLNEEKVAEIREMLASHNMAISSLAYYPNNLDPDLQARERYHAHLKKVIEAASKLNVSVVGTFVGRDPYKTVEENFKSFQKVFPDIVKFAEDHNVRLAIENCPMVVEHGGPSSWPTGTNLAYSPEIWARMFEMIPSEYFGLNFDPSHLIWQGIDYVKAVKDFKDKIFHTHAKDTKIDKDVLSQVGIFGTGWWIDKLPGLGDINWGRYISTLYEIGYDNVISIEHEDRAWEKSEEKIKQGLLLARDVLSPYIR